MSTEHTDSNSSVSMSRSIKSNDLATHKHSKTKLEDRISLIHKIVYGLGAFVNNLLAAAIGGMVIVLNLGLGMNPALVGLLGALPRLTDAITDPLMGYISDNTRSRWGRRRTYIFGGAIAAGIFFALLWQLPIGMSETYYFWYFLVGSFIFYLGYTVFATPWVALGYELTPDYHERTRLMGVQNVMGQMAYIAAGGFLLNATGFDVELQGHQTEQTIFLMRFFDVVIPILTTAMAMWAVHTFSITEERAHEIRTQLEARRGVADAE